MNIYRLKSEIAAILARVEEGGGELTPEDLQEIESLTTSTDDLINTYFKITRHAIVCETALRNESAYMLKQANWYSSLKERAREQLKKVLEVLQVTRYQTDLCRPTICKGPPVVEVADGFNLSSLKGTPYADLIEETTYLLGSKVKELHKKGGALPEGIKVVPGKDYLRL